MSFNSAFVITKPLLFCSPAPTFKDWSLPSPEFLFKVMIAVGNWANVPSAPAKAVAGSAKSPLAASYNALTVVLNLSPKACS